MKNRINYILTNIINGRFSIKRLETADRKKRQQLYIKFRRAVDVNKQYLTPYCLMIYLSEINKWQALISAEDFLNKMYFWLEFWIRGDHENEINENMHWFMRTVQIYKDILATKSHWNDTYCFRFSFALARLIRNDTNPNILKETHEAGIFSYTTPFLNDLQKACTYLVRFLNKLEGTKKYSVDKGKVFKAFNYGRKPIPFPAVFVWRKDARSGLYQRQSIEPCRLWLDFNYCENNDFEPVAINRTRGIPYENRRITKEVKAAIIEAVDCLNQDPEKVEQQNISVTSAFFEIGETSLGEQITEYDGESIGAAIFCSTVSLILKQQIPSDVFFTGRTGYETNVAGIFEKAQIGWDNGKKKFIMPYKNYNNTKFLGRRYDWIKDKENFNFIPYKNMRDLFEIIKDPTKQVESLEDNLSIELDEIGYNDQMDVNAHLGESSKSTFLIRAANMGRADAGHFLIHQRKADPDMGYYKNMSALHWAVKNGDLPMVKTLIDKNADIQKKVLWVEYGFAGFEHNSEYSGDTPLFLALRAGNDKIVEILVDEGAKLGDADLSYNEDYTFFDFYEVADMMHYPALKVLLKNYEFINARNRASAFQACLGSAVSKGSLGFIDWLIKEGGEELKEQYYVEDTHYSLESLLESVDNWIDFFSRDIIERLTSLCNESNIEDSICTVCRNMNFEMITEENLDWLISTYKSALEDIELVLLRVASLQGSTEIVKYLLSFYEVDPNCISKNNAYTPLITAAIDGQTETVKLLVNSGADVNIPHWAGFNALIGIIMFNISMFPYDVRFIEAVKYLLKKGSDLCLDYYNSGGFNALHLAIKSKNFDLASLLLDSGADITKKTQDGRTALMLADDKKMKELILKKILCATVERPNKGKAL